MEVNFDGLRKNGIRAYNALATALNRHVHGEEMGPGRNHGDQFCTGDIRDEMDALRSFVATVGLLEGDQTDVKALEFEPLVEFDPDGGHP